MSNRKNYVVYMLNQLAIFPSLNVWVICGYEAFVQKSFAIICYDSALSQFGKWPTCLNNSLSPFFLKFTSVYLSTQRDSSVLRLLVYRTLSYALADRAAK